VESCCQPAHTGKQKAKSGERLLGRKHGHVERQFCNATGSRHRPPNESPRLTIQTHSMVRVPEVVGE